MVVFCTVTIFSIATFFICAAIIGILLLTCESEIMDIIFSSEGLTSDTYSLCGDWYRGNRLYAFLIFWMACVLTDRLLKRLSSSLLWLSLPSYQLSHCPSYLVYLSFIDYTSICPRRHLMNGALKLSEKDLKDGLKKSEKE